jgi:hypothetical protein
MVQSPRKEQYLSSRLLKVNVSQFIEGFRNPVNKNILKRYFGYRNTFRKERVSITATSITELVAFTPIS